MINLIKSLGKKVINKMHSKKKLSNNFKLNKIKSKNNKKIWNNKNCINHPKKWLRNTLMIQYIKKLFKG